MLFVREGTGNFSGCARSSRSPFIPFVSHDAKLNSKDTRIENDDAALMFTRTKLDAMTMIWDKAVTTNQSINHQREVQEANILDKSTSLEMEAKSMA